MFGSVYLLLYCLYQVATLNIKIFVPNSNYGNLDNWREHQIPCEETHVIFPDKSPKVFLNGTSTIYHISEMVLPLNGELILDDRATITVADTNRDTECELIMSHYGKVKPDFWYNPVNWCQARTLTSSCSKKPQIEASMVPSMVDTAVFRRRNTFYVGVTSSEPNIVAKEILFRGLMYRNSNRFRNKIRRTLGSNIVEFENINSKYPPIIEINGDKCKGNSCRVNSNLKRMVHICRYVTCRPVSCQRTIKPTGSCCQLCGKMFSVKIHEYGSKSAFEKWFETLMDTYYETKLIFNVLAVEELKVEIVISSLDIDTDVPDSLATDIVEKILVEKHLIGIESVEGMSWTMASHATKTYGSALLVIVLVVMVVLAIILLFLFRRQLPRLAVFPDKLNISVPKMPTIKWPTFQFNFFRDTFPRTRLNEEVDNATIPGSIFPSMHGAVETIELPEKVADVSFDNPIYEAEMSYEDTLQ